MGKPNPARDKLIEEVKRMKFNVIDERAGVAKKEAYAKGQADLLKREMEREGINYLMCVGQRHGKCKNAATVCLDCSMEIAKEENEKGRASALDDVEKELKEIRNPYPANIFTDKKLTKDGEFGTFGRKVWQNAMDEVREALAAARKGGKP